MQQRFKPEQSASLLQSVNMMFAILLDVPDFLAILIMVTCYTCLQLPYPVTAIGSSHSQVVF